MSSYYGAHLIYHPQRKTFFILKGGTLNSQSQTTCVDRHNPRQSRSVLLLPSHLEAPPQSTPAPCNELDFITCPLPCKYFSLHTSFLAHHSCQIFSCIKIIYPCRCFCYCSFSYPQKSLRIFPWFLLECLLAREAFMEISAESAFISCLMCSCSSIILQVFPHTVYQHLILSVDMFTIAFLVH